MDATSWVLIITAIGSSIGAIVLSVVTQVLTYKREMRNKESLDRMERVGDKTHALVNSQSLATERLYLVALRKISEDDPTNNDKRLAADAMEKQVKEHEERQQIVDDNLKG